MVTGVSVPRESELQLCLLDRRAGIEPGRFAGLAAASIALNLLLGISLSGLASMQGGGRLAAIPVVDTRKSTPLIFPSELTQKAPNQAKVSKQVHLEDLMPEPKVLPRQRMFTPPPAPRQTARQTPPAPTAEPPPAIRVTETPPPALGVNPNLPPPPVSPSPAQPRETPPKLAFETPGSPSGPPIRRSGGLGQLAPPKASVEETVQNMSRSGPGGVVIGDMPDEGGLGQVLGQAPSPGRQASQVELLSDPMGVDFKPYLIRVLAAVRRNWFAVIPESARMGRRGRVVIQFSVNRAGSVPKLVIATPSGTEAFDRAGVAGISASNPFPPLPSEFKGQQITLQLVFYYNVPSR